MNDPFFCGPGLDRADPLRARPEAIARLASDPRARALAWHDGTPRLSANGALAWGPALGNEPLFLGFDGQRRPCFSALPPPAAEPGIAARFAQLADLSPTDAPLFAAALSLARWHQRHPYCAACGQPSVPNRGGWSRACAACGAEHYPRVDPVVIMLAEHDGRLLLGRQPQFAPGRYSALAGFVEPGESLEDAVRRELGEEAGIAVGAVRYVASQPWPYPNSLMVGMRATALGTELRIDRDELDDARWFSRYEVEAALAGAADPAFVAPPRFAIARTLLEAWLGAA